MKSVKKATRKTSWWTVRGKMEQKTNKLVYVIQNIVIETKKKLNPTNRKYTKKV